MPDLVRALRGLCAAVCTLASVGPAAAWGENIPGVEVVDTGIEVMRSETDFTAEWLDERRVAFSEMIDAGFYEQPGRSRDPRHHLQIVIYDVISREKKAYAKGWLYCLKNGRIGYSIKEPDPSHPGGYRTALLSGEMGKEQPVARSPETKLFHDDDCAMRDKVPEHKFGRNIHYLKREHGFIDGGNHFGAGDDKYTMPAVLHRPGQEPVTLPFMGAYIGSGIHWSEYWGGYILQYTSGGFEPPRGVTPPLSATRLLKPDGQVTVFPRGGGQTRTRAIQYRRRNWNIDNPGDSGVYVHDESRWVRVHRGLILPTSSDAGHSPDGYRVAFASRQGFRYNVPAYLMILNVCAGDNK